MAPNNQLHALARDAGQTKLGFVESKLSIRRIEADHGMESKRVYYKIKEKRLHQFDIIVITFS